MSYTHIDSIVVTKVSDSFHTRVITVSSFYSTKIENDRSMYKQIWSPIKKASILVFETTIKLFELKIIASFEVRVDIGVGDKIEWFIVKRRIATCRFVGREVANCITKTYAFEKQLPFFGKQASLWKQRSFISFYT